MESWPSSWEGGAAMCACSPPPAPPPTQLRVPLVGETRAVVSKRAAWGLLSRGRALGVLAGERGELIAPRSGDKGLFILWLSGHLALRFAMCFQKTDRQWLGLAPPHLLALLAIGLI